MATMTTATPTPTLGQKGRFSQFLARRREHAARKAVYRQTVRELSNLTQRDLDDLGIARSMITRIATEAAFGSKAD